MTDLIASDQTIRAGSRVTLHFSLALADGAATDAVDNELIDGTAPDQPATFTMGDGSLLPGFEACLVGLRPGAASEFVLAAGQAFGERRDENLRTLPRAQFAGGAMTGSTLEPGLLVSFAAADGELPGLVHSMDENQVTVDFNHPLAGRAIRFAVRIVAVEQAAPGTD